MVRRILSAVLLTTVLAAAPDAARAHYLWIVPGDAIEGRQSAEIYFEEAPAPGDGSYLDHFLGKTDVWLRTLEEPMPRTLKSAEVKQADNRWMRAGFPATADYSIDAYGKFGVYEYGTTTVLLHYYARFLKASSHDAIHELGRAEQMELDLVPHDVGQNLELTLLWQEKPAAGRMLFVRGPKGLRQNVLTDSKGRVVIAPREPGQYTFRSSVEVPAPGEEAGEPYDLIRRNITLVMNLPLGIAMSEVPKKKYALPGDAIRPLATGRGGCLATDRITVDGQKVGFMYREAPVNPMDSGWRFMAGNESDEYMDNPDHHGVYDINTIANYDPEVIPFLDAPEGAAFERNEQGKLVAVDFEPPE